MRVIALSGLYDAVPAWNPEPATMVPVRTYRADNNERREEKISVADPDPRSRIGCFFDPWIRDPG